MQLPARAALPAPGGGAELLPARCVPGPGGGGEPEHPAPAEESTLLTASPRTPVEPTPAQRGAAEVLWAAAAAVLGAGVPAAGAVPQAELLRAAHTARLADLYRAEAAALRVVRGLRSARAGHRGHRTADLAAALRELLLSTALVRSGPVDPGCSAAPAAPTALAVRCGCTGPAANRC